MTTDEIIKAEQARKVQTLMDKPETEDDYLNIDWDTREVDIPDELENIGVYSDADTNRLYFRCPATFGEFALDTFSLRVNFANYDDDDEQWSSDYYICDDAEVDGDGYLTFSWLVGRNAYLVEGECRFVVCCKLVDSEGFVQRELNTTTAYLPVLEGLEPEGSEPVVPTPDYGRIVFCDTVPEEGQENILYIMKSLATAYIWADGAWIPLAGGEALPLYTGDTTVIPKVGEEQVLDTASKTLADDITVTKIPVSDVDNEQGGTTVTIG